MENQQEGQVLGKMPEYRCHKIVSAIKIESILKDGEGQDRETDGSALLVGDGLQIKINHSYMHKHKPEVGGYYVEYKDGYESFSPAEAFEEGYTKV